MRVRLGSCSETDAKSNSVHVSLALLTETAFGNRRRRQARCEQLPTTDGSHSSNLRSLIECLGILVDGQRLQVLDVEKDIATRDGVHSL